MVPVKFLIAFAAVFDGVLYVLQPPHSISASINGDRNASNATWNTMDTTVLADIPVFKIPVKNFTEHGLLTFKIKFHYPTYAVTTNWQSIMVREGTILKTFIEPTNNFCCISSVILGTALFIILGLCIAYFFVHWSLNFYNLG